MTNLLKSSCADSTWKQYESHFKKWTNFCSINSESVWKPSLQSVLSFLADLYEKGLGYMTINSVRSSLSLMLGNIEGQAIGTHPLVCRLLKGIANKRPPKPKYKSTWDASRVLQYFKDSEPNSSLCLKDLSEKLIALLALTTGQRVQTLAAINTSNINFLSDESVEIIICDKLKTSKPGESIVLSLPKYTDVNICVVEALKQYLLVTETLRTANNLFVSTRSPYKPVSRDTLSRWLKYVLKKSGIDVSTYSGHSFRHASTSKADNFGVSIDSIYNAAGWSKNSTVFAKHYKRAIVNKHEFANAVLNG